MYASHIAYEAWEPVFARAKWHPILWRLDYCGTGQWNLYFRKGVWRNVTKWFLEASGDVDSLSRWARKKRDLDIHRYASCDLSLFRQLGIRMSGSYETRVRNLRDSLICIGSTQQSTTEGGVGTSFVLTVDVEAYAELGNNGGIDVWARKTSPFSSESELVCCGSDLTTMSEIENALREEEIYPQCRKNQKLLEMLDSIWASPFRSSEKQSFVAKPNVRPHGHRELVCTKNECDGVYWYENGFWTDLISGAMDEIRERGLSINWHELLEGRDDLMPKLWISWNERVGDFREESCEQLLPRLIDSFPGTYCKSELIGGTMLMSTAYEYYVLSSHKDWLFSCFEFVGGRLKLFVDDHETA